MAELNWAELVGRKFKVFRVTSSDTDRGIKIGDCVKLKHAGTRANLGVFELKDGKDWVLLHCQVKVIIEILPKKSFADIIDWGKVPAWVGTVTMDANGDVIMFNNASPQPASVINEWVYSSDNTGHPSSFLFTVNPDEFLEDWTACCLERPDNNGPDTEIGPNLYDKPLKEFIRAMQASLMKRKPPFPPINVNVLWHRQYGFECNFRKNGISGARLLQLIASGNKTERHPNELYIEAYDDGEWISGDGLVYKRETQD